MLPPDTTVRLSREQLADLDAAVADAPNEAVLQETLYRLCREYPGHADRAAAHAKVLLIGRGLATGIERLLISRGGQGGTMLALAAHLHDRHEQADAILDSLRPVEEPLDLGGLRTIVEAHGRFCRLLQPVLRKSVLRKKQSARSFAAKYLHCHCPAVPIFDSYTRDKLERLVTWQDRFQVFDRPADADEMYFWFVLRFWQLYQAAREPRPGVNVWLLDLYLLR